MKVHARLGLPVVLGVFLAYIEVIADELTYERDVRPILKTHCFQCHGEGDELQGDLDLRLRRLIAKGGDSGSAIAFGRSADSLLYQRLRDGEMPPEEVETRPSSEEVQIIERWLAAGAKTARDEPDDLDPDTYITEEERSFWSFQPIQRPELAAVPNGHRARTPIDRFLLAKLEANDMSFSEDADKRTMLQRAYFDLLGLPPPVDEAERFLNDDSPNAYERLVERLLSSPHYGERWGRHWLDVAGYADSEGYTDTDAVRPDAYKYRDYVIRSFNADKAFDQFIVEQLSGDELVGPPYENLSPDEVDKLVATGFLRMAPDGTGGKNVDQNLARNDVMAKTVEIVSTSLLGLTVACAQCHNHRYDPISQADYYALRAIFEPALNWKNWRTPSQRRISLYTGDERARAKEIEEEAKKIEGERSEKQEEFIQQTFDKELAKLPDELREPIRKARNTPPDQQTPQQKKLLNENPSVNVTTHSLYLYDRKAADELKRLADEAAKVRDTKPKEEFVRALSEPAGKVPPRTFLFHRGDHEQPKQELEPSELAVLSSPRPVGIQPNDDALSTTGRRLSYARWLTSGEHPLVARALVNRVWLHNFGRGLVKTPGDFGYLGQRPTHPELLDWLASEFVAQGWSLKRLQHMIMLSTVYRQSSQRDPGRDSLDAQNQLYWHMPLRRLDAEVLRDSILALSGQLNRKPYGPAVPVISDRVGQFVIGIENFSVGRPGNLISMQREESRRTVYIQVRRSRPLSVLAPFDLPAMEPNCTVRKSSTVSTQALLLMNSRFVTAQSDHFARRVRSAVGDDVTSQVVSAWQWAYADRPSDDELSDAIQFVYEQAEYFKFRSADKKRDPQLDALASFCHALLSSNEFLYVD